MTRQKVSVKCRSCIGQVSVKCRLSIGEVSVNCRSNIGQVSVKYRSSIDGLRLYRLTYLSVDSRPIYRSTIDRYISRLSANYWSTIDRYIGRPIYRPSPRIVHKIRFVFRVPRKTMALIFMREVTYTQLPCFNV